MNEIKRPKQQVKRDIKRSPNIALDEYMFDRKMQSLYYGAKPKSDDLPLFFKWVRNTFRHTKKEVNALPRTIPHAAQSLKKSFRKYPARYLAGSLLAFLVILFIAVQVSRQSSKSASTTKDGKTAASQPVESKIPLNQSPTFPVELPQGRTATDVGGWAKVSPPGQADTYAYKDRIDNVNILVSEQQLPEAFKTDTSAQVEKLAIGFNASQSVKTEKVEFFVRSNSDGEQSVITYSKTLLIFLKSSAKVTNARWQTYIEDLK